MDESIRDGLRRLFASWQREEANPVRIGLLGQPGAGKSSLINSLIGSEQAAVGVQTDKTRDVEEFHWGGMVLVDLPGYGTERFPDKTFFNQFAVLDFDALLCVASGKFRDADARFFREVVKAGKAVLFVRTFADALKQRGKTREQLQLDVSYDLAQRLHTNDFRLLFVDNISGGGRDDLASAISEVVPPARRAQFLRWAAGRTDAFLQDKRDSVNPMIRWFAAGAALGGLNPVPIAGVAIDLGVVAAMQKAILKSFGFTDEILRDHEGRYAFLTTYIGPLLNTLGKDALIALAARFAIKETAKWVPIVGQVIAGATGALLVYLAGQDLADRCHDLARRVRDAEMTVAAA